MFKVCIYSAISQEIRESQYYDLGTALAVANAVFFLSQGEENIGHVTVYDADGKEITDW